MSSAAHPFELSAQPCMQISPCSAEFGSHRCPTVHGGPKNAQKPAKSSKMCRLACCCWLVWRAGGRKKADFWNATLESAPTLASHPYMYVGGPHGCGRESRHQSAATWSVERAKCFEKAENKNKYTRYGPAHLPPDPRARKCLKKWRCYTVYIRQHVSELGGPPL